MFPSEGEGDRTKLFGAYSVHLLYLLSYFIYLMPILNILFIYCSLTFQNIWIADPTLQIILIYNTNHAGSSGFFILLFFILQTPTQ